SERRALAWSAARPQTARQPQAQIRLTDSLASLDEVSSPGPRMAGPPVARRRPIRSGAQKSKSRRDPRRRPRESRQFPGWNDLARWKARLPTRGALSEDK